MLKLKEQREALKEDGAVHEDLIMKENAKLQVLNANFQLFSVYQKCYQNCSSDQEKLLKFEAEGREFEKI